MTAQPVVSAEAVGKPASMWTMALAFTRLEVIEDLSYPLSVVFQQFGAIFPVFLYYFVAQLVPNSGRGAHVGGDYFSFAVIGLAVTVALHMSLSGFGRRLEYAQNQGTFETILVEPVPWSAVPLALNIWRTALGVVDCALLLAVGVMLGADFRIDAILSFAGLLLLGVLACTAIGTLSASLQVLAKRSQPVLGLYSLAASLLGGALFPIEVMPRWLQFLSYGIPHMYVIDAARSLLMVDPPTEGMRLGSALLALAIINVVVFALAIPLFTRSLQCARRMGLISGY